MAQLRQLDMVGDFQRSRQNALTQEMQGQQIASERAAAPLRQEAAQLGLDQAKRLDAQSQRDDDFAQITKRNKTMNNVAKAILGLPETQWAGAIDRLNPQLQEMGLPPIPADQMTRERFQEIAATTGAFIKDPASLTAAQKEHSGHIEAIKSALDKDGNFDPKKADASAMAAAAALGLVSKMGTLSKDERIEATGKTDAVAESVATIAGATEFAKKTGASRAQAIDSGIESIQKIDKNIRNIDRAVSALDEGASTGVIESRFFPSFRESTLKLEQIQKELGLDVIGATTFGALSKGELDLALETALPTNLEPDALKSFLIDKKAAQTKLRAYYEEQIDFLDQGGTIASFLRKKRRESPESQAAEEVQTEEAETVRREGGELQEDANGNRAMVFPDGSFEEVQ